MTAKKTEVHSEDFTPAQRPVVDLSLDTDLTIIRENEDIVTEISSVNKSYLDELAFMEETLTIQLSPSSEKNAPNVVSASVNGVTIWIEVGEPTEVKRKFVEVLARCKSDAIDTVVKTMQNGDSVNQFTRSTSNKHPFSVLHDPSSRGYEWITQLFRS